MKTSTHKTIVVKCANFWTDEFNIDPEIFDDVYLEAATRAVEKRKTTPGFKVTVMIECWDKKNTNVADKHFCYNTYFVFVNAGLHVKAEILRLNFFNENKIDLQKESLKPKETNG